MGDTDLTVAWLLSKRDPQLVNNGGFREAMLTTATARKMIKMLGNRCGSVRSFALTCTVIRVLLEHGDGREAMAVPETMQVLIEMLEHPCSKVSQLVAGLIPSLVEQDLVCTTISIPQAMQHLSAMLSRASIISTLNWVLGAFFALAGHAASEISTTDTLQKILEKLIYRELDVRHQAHLGILIHAQEGPAYATNWLIENSRVPMVRALVDYLSSMIDPSHTDEILTAISMPETLGILFAMLSAPEAHVRECTLMTITALSQHDVILVKIATSKVVETIIALVCHILSQQQQKICGRSVRTFCKGTAVQQLTADWWTPGIYAWEGRTPPVQQLTQLVVRSHWVLSGCPAIKTAGQSTLPQAQRNKTNSEADLRHSSDLKSMVSTQLNSAQVGAAKSTPQTRLCARDNFGAGNNAESLPATLQSDGPYPTISNGDHEMYFPVRQSLSAARGAPDVVRIRYCPGGNYNARHNACIAYNPEFAGKRAALWTSNSVLSRRAR
ncbi:hypothetical protein B0H19DRAFT_1239246 [Mycena capillaripes]|nr:hypothetical protein B0H19DRAFT_1239246 [Mycena capillaripes]